VSAGGQWLVLAVLVIVVAVASLGLPTVRAALDTLRGLVFARPPAASVSPPSSAPSAALQARIEAAAAVSRGTLGVAAIDLETGASASVNAERAFPAASLFKLPILVEVLAQEASGRLPGDRVLEIGDDDWTSGSGVLQARVGERLSVRELRRLMIQESDNIAALVLLEAVGASNVNARLTSLGMSSTRVIDFRGGQRGEHVTSPTDMARLLAVMARGQLVSAQVSEEALRLLELRQAHTWLADDLPWWVKVAHKWGDLPEARNDVGVVFTPSGSYVIAVLSEDAPPDEAQRAIARTSQAVFAQIR